MAKFEIDLFEEDARNGKHWLSGLDGTPRPPAPDEPGIGTEHMRVWGDDEHALSDGKAICWCEACRSERRALAEYDESKHPRDNHGRWATAAGGDNSVSAAQGTLLHGEKMPPKTVPVVLVYGGSFNPPHVGHVQAGMVAASLLEKDGYNVERVIVAPTADKLLKDKLGASMYPLEDRTTMTKAAFGGIKDVTVTSGPGLEAEHFEGKLRRTQLADWAAKNYPGRTIINVTGEDSAPGHPPGFPSLYTGDPGTKHEGYYYLALHRPEGGVSSSKIRAAIRDGRPTSELHAKVREHLTKMFASNPHIALADWDESAHPRVPSGSSEGGEFTSGGGGGGGTAHRVVHLPGDPATWRYPQNQTEDYFRKDGKWDPDRAAIQERIIEQTVPETLPRHASPTLYMMGGGGASGKSTLTKMGLIDLPGKDLAAHVDPDGMQEALPEFQRAVAVGNKDSAGIVHEEASFMSKAALGRALLRGNDVIYDGTGDGDIKSLQRKIGLMRTLGAATVIGEYVTVDTETAVQRNLTRSRQVPEPALRAAHAGVSRSFPDAVKLGLFDAVRLWDTNGAKPKLIATAEGKKLTIRDQAAYNRFLAKATPHGTAAH